MKNIKLTIILLLAGIISINAQSDETKAKLKSIDATVTKITIETEDGNVEIVGDDAVALFKKMKSQKKYMVKTMGHGKHGEFMFFNDGTNQKNMDVEIEIDNTDGEQVVIVKKNVDGKETIKKHRGEEAEKFISEHSKNGNDGIIIVKMDDNIDWISNGDEDCLTKKINVEIENGERTITVTTTENGEESVEVYSGKDADNFLKNNSNSDKKIIFISEDDEESTVRMIVDSDNLQWISENGNDNINENVNIEINDGVKKVTVTTIKDGKETVKIYEGDKAEKFLEEQDNMKKMKIFISDEGDSVKVMKKVIFIKEIEEENSDN
jgi:hypothetical protein